MTDGPVIEFIRYIESICMGRIGNSRRVIAPTTDAIMRWINIGSHAVTIVDRCDKVRCSRRSGAARPLPKREVIGGVHMRAAYIEIKQDITVGIDGLRPIESRRSSRGPCCWQQAIEIAGMQDRRNRQP